MKGPLDLKNTKTTKRIWRYKMIIKFKRLNEFAIIPTRADDGSAGWDLSIPNDPSLLSFTLMPGERKLVKLGFSTEIREELFNIYQFMPHLNTDAFDLKKLLPSGYQVEIRPRSGNALKRGLTVLNTPGTIDASYRGEWGVILYNASNETITLYPGDKIAQAVLMPYYNQEWVEVDELSETKRGVGGFGSSGTVK